MLIYMLLFLYSMNDLRMTSLLEILLDLNYRLEKFIVPRKTKPDFNKTKMVKKYLNKNYPLSWIVLILFDSYAKTNVSLTLSCIML